MERLDEFYKFLASLAIEDNGPGFKSERIRDFVRDFGIEYDIDEVVEYAIYHAFVEQFPSVKVSRNYFHTVCSRGFKTFTTPTNVTMIDLRKQKNIKSQKRKI